MVQQWDLDIRPTRAEADANYVSYWRPNTEYRKDQRVVSPNNDVVSAISAFTSGTTYNPANFNFSGSYALTMPPSYAGTARTAKTWNRELSLYNGESPVLQKIRKRVAGARSGVRCHILAVGDSKTAGWGTNNGGNIIAADSYPGQLADLLGATEGVIYANTFHGSGTSTGLDTRWANIAGFVRESSGIDGRKHYLKSPSTGNSTLRLTPGRASTGIRVYGWNGASNVVSISIDGGTASTWTPAGGTAWSSFDITGLSNTAHTVDISVTGIVAILGVELLQTTGQLQVSNAGISSIKANEWLDAGDFTSPRRTAIAGSGITSPDVAFVNLGTNQDATTVADLGTVLSDLGTLGIPTLLLNPGALYHTGIDPLRSSIYDLAESKDLPMIDLTHAIGDQAQAGAKGMVYDSLHENAKGYGLEAWAIARVISMR